MKRIRMPALRNALLFAFGVACLDHLNSSPARAFDLQSAPWVEQKVTASDGNEQDWFGSSVAISGNTAMIGAKNADGSGGQGHGAVYVFTKANGIWAQSQKLTSPDVSSQEQFGSSIVLNGDIAVITAPNAIVNGNMWQGAAYVFRLIGGSWTMNQKLVASEGAAFHTFGRSVAMNSNRIFIGAGGANSGGTVIDRSVHVFQPDPLAREPKPWIEVETLTPPVHVDNGSYGASLAASDTTLLIGSRAATINGNLGQGAVYVYHDVNGHWTLVEQLTSNDGGARDNFGVSIAIEGTTALFGAPGAVINGNVSQGAVYRFQESSGVWLQQQKMLAADGAAINLFGASVSLKGSTALVGAYAQNSYLGAAYVFKQSPFINWIQDQKLTASDGVAGSVFGYYTALAQGTALVSAYTTTVDGALKQGAAYFFTDPCIPGNPPICTE